MTHITFFDRLRTWSVLLPFLLLLGATYWLDQQVQPLPPQADENKRHDPDYIVNSLSATTLDEHGKPHYLMTAEKLVHYPDDDSTHMVKPQLISLYANRPPVYVSALRGEVSSEGDQVFLHDDVKVIRAASASRSQTTFTTSFLHVLPDQDLADTDRPVTIVDDSTVVNGIGMKLNNKTGVAELLAQVRSQHETTQH